MVHSWWGLLFTAVEFVPTKGRSFYGQAPNIIYRLLAGVSTENEQVGLAENDSVAISSSRRASDDRHNHPLGHRLAIPHIKKVKVIRGQTSAASGTRIHDHLHLLDISG